MMAITFGFSIHYTFGNIHFFLQNFPHSSLCFFSFLTFQLFQKFSFFKNNVTLMQMGLDYWTRIQFLKIFYGFEIITVLV